MTYPKKTHAWLCSDGKAFEREAAANAHEAHVGIGSQMEEFLKVMYKRPEGSTPNFVGKTKLRESLCGHGATEKKMAVVNMGAAIQRYIDARRVELRDLADSHGLAE